MSESLSEFQKLLRKTQQEMLLKPKEKIEKIEKIDKNREFLKFQQLPTEIKLSGSSLSNSGGFKSNSVTFGASNLAKTASFDSNATSTNGQPKKKSFKELMKMAKNVKLEGLVKTDSQSLTSRSKQTPSQTHAQKYKIVTPIHKMIQPKSKVFSTQSSKRGKKYVPADLIKLNVNKRDLASTEEIQDELLKKRGFVKQQVFKDARTMGSRLNLDPNAHSRSLSGTSLNPSSQKVSARRERSAERYQDRSARPEGVLQQDRREQPAERYQDRDKDRRERPLQISIQDRDRRERPQERRESRQSHDYSSVIQDIFGRGRKRPAYDDYSDDSSDMEANFADIHKEEQRSLKIGKKEDEITEMELKAKAEAKRKNLS
jgi:hypothetical protein